MIRSLYRTRDYYLDVLCDNVIFGTFPSSIFFKLQSHSRIFAFILWLDKADLEYFFERLPKRLLTGVKAILEQ